MKHILVGQDDLIGPWVVSKSGGDWQAGRATAIGLLDDQAGIIAGILCEDYNGKSLFMHMASDKTKGTVTRKYLWFCFYYAFEILGCEVVFGYVPSSLSESQKAVKQLGFSLKATLEKAHPHGDLLLYEMRKQDCKWLNFKRVENGKIKEATTAT